MKKMLWIVLAALVLAGCSQAPAAETVTDVLEEPVMAQPRELHLELPGETVACAMESDSGRLYLGDGYEVMVQTLPGGDLDATIRSLTGFHREDITVLQSQSDPKRWEFTWASAGEGGLSCWARPGRSTSRAGAAAARSAAPTSTPCMRP